MFVGEMESECDLLDRERRVLQKQLCGVDLARQDIVVGGDAVAAFENAIYLRRRQMDVFGDPVETQRFVNVAVNVGFDLSRGSTDAAVF